jgi:hypothetical protein
MSSVSPSTTCWRGVPAESVGCAGPVPLRPGDGPGLRPPRLSSFLLCCTGGETSHDTRSEDQPWRSDPVLGIPGRRCLRGRALRKAAASEATPGRTPLPWAHRNGALQATQASPRPPAQTMCLQPSSSQGRTGEAEGTALVGPPGNRRPETFRRLYRRPGALFPEGRDLPMIFTSGTVIPFAKRIGGQARSGARSRRSRRSCAATCR